MISAYLKLEASKAGKVKGPVQDRDEKKNGSIALIAVDHGIASPRDPASGMVAGKRQHRPITLTKETDVTSPLFYEFIADNETLPTVEIYFYGVASQSGPSVARETMLYKISLKNAFVSRVEFGGHTDATAQQNDRFPLTETISLVYDSIQWEWTSPNVTRNDLFSSK
jgi:type VI secretion system secreted protein Hcp